MAVDSGTVQVVMPTMGDSVSEGTVLEWHKQVGDPVQADETIVEISTDKVDAEVPSPATGTVTRLNFAEGDTVSVGAVLAEIATNGTGTPTGPVSAESPPATPEEARSAQATEAEHVRAGQRAAEAVGDGAAEDGAVHDEAVGDAATDDAQAGEADAGQIVDIVTPTGGELVTEGTILEWSVEVGQMVRQGDTVVEISTDKVDMELPAPAS